MPANFLIPYFFQAEKEKKRDNARMVDLDKFRQRDRRPCYVLRVAGVQVLYGTHAPFTIPTSSMRGGLSYEKRVSIVPDGISFSRRIDENARIVQVENLSVTLSSDELYTSDPYDPGKIFGRIGYQGADVFTRLQATVSNDTTVFTVQDNSNLTTGDLLHIGPETIRVDSILSNNQISVTRGLSGTFAKKHTVDEAVGSYPYLTSPLVYFRGRRVVLYEGIVNEDGTVSDSIDDYIEVFRGFIASEPSHALDGRSHQVKLEIAPLTALLDKKLPTSSEKTRMHQALHTFDGEVASKMVFTSYTLNGQMYESNAIVYSLSNSFFFIDHSASEIEHRFENDYAAYHPRAMSIEPNWAFDKLWVGPSSVNGTNLDDFYPTAANSSSNAFGALTSNEYHDTTWVIKSAPSVESKVVKIPTSATRNSPITYFWKDQLSVAINSQLAQSSIFGLYGFLFDINIDSAVGDLFISPNFSRKEKANIPSAQIVLSNNPTKVLGLINREFQSEQSATQVQHLSDIKGRTLQYDSAAGSNAPGSGGDTYRLRSETISFGTEDHPNDEFLPSKALQLDDDDNNPRVFTLQGKAQITTDGGVTVPVKIADAFLHLGSKFNGSGEETPVENCEQYVFLEGAIGSGSSADVAVEKNGELIAYLELVSKTQLTVGGQTGYRYKINRVVKFEDVATVADMPGEPRHDFIATVNPSESNIRLLLLRLLMSIEGAGVSSSLDAYQIGAGLSDGTGTQSADFGADIDTDSFEAIPNPAGSESFTPVYKSGDTILDIVEGMLNLVNYTLDISTDFDGKCRLRAVEIGLPDSSNIVRDFTARDISDGSVPTSEAELSIKNIFNFSLNHDHKGDPGLEISVKDQVSIDLFNEAQSLDLDLRGVKIEAGAPGDAVHTLRPVFSKLRLENSYPRRVFTMEVATSLLQQIALGDTCTVTHPLLRSTNGLGITAEPARVRSIEYDGYAPTGRIELVGYGVSGQSWNMAITVLSVLPNTSSKRLIVSNHLHSPKKNPKDGSTVYDNTGFYVGQSVDIYAPHDMDSPAQTTTITSILGSATIEIYDSLSVSTYLGFPLAFIVPRSFSNAGETEKLYGYIGRTTAT